jgi:ribosomal protein S6
VRLLRLSAGLKTITKVQQTNYELAFHLNPNLEEAKVQEIRQSIESIITSNKGVVSYSKEPEKTHLSYEIKHFGNSLFGYIQFNLSESQALDELNEQIKLNPEVLRYLIIKLPSDLQKKQSMLKQIKMKERQEKRAQAKASAPIAPGENKELDKKLEELIGGL